MTRILIHPAETISPCPLDALRTCIRDYLDMLFLAHLPPICIEAIVTVDDRPYAWFLSTSVSL